MLHSRIKSSKLIILPETRQSIQRKQQQWKQYHRSLFSHQNIRDHKRNISTAPFKYDSENKLLHNRLVHQRNIQKMQLQDQDNAQSIKLRPFTEMKKNKINRLQSPLSIMRSTSKILSQNVQRSSENHTKSQRKIRVNFLRKGKAVDKAIIMNVLKSKLNLNVCANTFSYTNDPKNSELIKIIQSQIPKGIKDIVGAEEMIRMSHIMTGTNFSNINMTKRLNIKLKQKNKLSQKINQQQDNITLRSIKRW